MRATAGRRGRPPTARDAPRLDHRKSFLTTAQRMPNIEDDIRKSAKRLKALRKTASAHNKANRIFVYKRDGQNVLLVAVKSAR